MEIMKESSEKKGCPKSIQEVAMIVDAAYRAAHLAKAKSVLASTPTKAKGIKCPICGDAVATADDCPICPSCGSLEGMDLTSTKQDTRPKAKKLFGYDWGAGFVAPFQSANNSKYYTVSVQTIISCLTALDLSGSPTLVDLGCG